MTTKWKCPRCETYNEGPYCSVCNMGKEEAMAVLSAAQKPKKATPSPELKIRTAPVSESTPKSPEVLAADVDKGVARISKIILGLTIFVFISLLWPNWQVRSAGRSVSMLRILSGTERSMLMAPLERLVAIIVIMMNVVPFVLVQIVKRVKYSIGVIFIYLFVEVCFSVCMFAVLMTGTADVQVIPIGYLYLAPLCGIIQFFLFLKNWKTYWM